MLYPHCVSQGFWSALKNLQDFEICFHGATGTNIKKLVTSELLGTSFFLSLKFFIIGFHIVFEGFESDLEKSFRNYNWYPQCQGYNYQHFGNLKIGSNFLLYFFYIL